MLLMTYMFRRVEIVNTKKLHDVHCTLGKSYKAEISFVYNKATECFSDLTIAVGHIIPCTQDILQFSNNKACSHTHMTAGLFLLAICEQRVIN